MIGRILAGVLIAALCTGVAGAGPGGLTKAVAGHPPQPPGDLQDGGGGRAAPNGRIRTEADGSGLRKRGFRDQPREHRHRRVRPDDQPLRLAHHQAPALTTPPPTAPPSPWEKPRASQISGTMSVKRLGSHAGLQLPHSVKNAGFSVWVFTLRSSTFPWSLTTITIVDCRSRRARAA